MNGGGSGTEVVGEVLSERLYGGCRGIVGGVGGGIGDALLRAGDNYRGRGGRGAKGGEEGGDTVEDAVEVCVEDLDNLVSWLIWSSAPMEGVGK